MIRTVALLGLLALAQGATAAEECGWLSNAAVDKAFPAYAPWSTMVGGTAGACQFLGSSRKGANIFGVNQMINGSEKEAVDLVRSMKSEIKKTHAVVPVPRLGAEGFVYQPKDGDPDANRRSMFFTGHHKQVVILGTLNLVDAITPETQKAAETLVLSAFVLADDPEALDAATHCKYFDTATLKKLLPGKDMKQQTYGENSCMANAGSAVVLVSITPSRGQEHADENCTSQPVPALGPTAIANFNCKGGNPHSKLGYVSGGKFIEYSLVPGHEPTAAEHELLIELVSKAKAR
jgi:hypothetical protein